MGVMSSRYNHAVRAFCLDVLHERNQDICMVVTEYGHYFARTLVDVDFTRSSLGECMTNVCRVLFDRRPRTLPYVMVLLAYSLYLHRYCLLNYEWYSPIILVDVLTPVLVRCNLNHHPRRQFCILL